LPWRSNPGLFRSFHGLDGTTIATQNPASTLSMHRLNTSHDAARTPVLSIWPVDLLVRL
jgi:hypothetical protein